MNKIKNDAKSQPDQNRQQGKSTITKTQNPSDVKAYTEETIGDSINNERTKMPGRESRTPVAGVKSTSQEKKMHEKGRL